MGFAPSDTFATDPPGSYTPFQSVESIRALFDDGTKVNLAIGGWGDTEGFSQGAADNSSRQLYAKNVASVLDQLGFDGVGKWPPLSSRTMSHHTYASRLT